MMKTRDNQAAGGRRGVPAGDAVVSNAPVKKVRPSRQERDAARFVAGRAAIAAAERRQQDLREFLMRRMHGLLGYPSACRIRGCRRARACVGAGLTCLRDRPPSPPSTPEENAQVDAAMNMLRDALRKRLERSGRPHR